MRINLKLGSKKLLLILIVLIGALSVSAYNFSDSIFTSGFVEAGFFFTKVSKPSGAATSSKVSSDEPLVLTNSNDYVQIGGSSFLPNPSADIDQCANDPSPSSPTDGCNSLASQWVNGNLGSSKSIYREGDSIPYRLKFGNLSLSSHTVTIEWDTTKSSKHALDYITTFNASVANANPCLGVANCSAFTTFPIPADAQVTGAGVTPIAGNFTLYGGTITGVSAYTYANGTGFTGDKSAKITITFTASQANPVLAWGGHIATRKDWGAGNSAVAITGSPYHTRLLDLDGSGGNQDRSLSADAVIFPGSVTVIKDAVPNNATDFSFSTTGGLSPATFSLDDDDDPTLSNTRAYTNLLIQSGNFTITEAPSSNSLLTGLTCSVDVANGGTSGTNTGTRTASITLKEGENWTCTFTNTLSNPGLSITKVATEASYNAVGQVIHYTIVATNTGNVTLSNVTVSDPKVSNLVCTPANGSSLAPGASLNCTATHTIVQADIDAGKYANTACVDDGPGGASQACASAEVPSVKSPALSITKVATEENYDSVDDIIHYTIVARNTGNVTLASVTITDDEAVLGTCTPANGSSLAPGASITCSATHVVTQEDIDAGTYNNTACVDDGAGGAAPVCADADVPAVQRPHLSIVKGDNNARYSALNDVITYSIVATNDGNVTLHNVTITDDAAVLGTCTPVNGSDLAPGGSITCSATHTINQGDLDAGSYLNTACVDDGDLGADRACDDESTPGDKNPELTITKDDDIDRYDSVDDVITYTIVAKNTGNVTLHNVLVTDPKVSDLVCDPANPVADLAPNETITCTATHKITLEDLDAGSYNNAVCVDDDPEDGAAKACADVTTPGDKNPSLAITKVATEESYNAVDQVIHYTIVATNTGNVTLNVVTVSDPNAANLVCDPANGSSLAPNAKMECTASHTVTQADLDAGSYFNEACVDDGKDGAAQACADVTTPGGGEPGLAITKVATEENYDAVDDVIHYTIIATNTGQLTLHNVSVTDPKVSDLSCDPATPVADFGPGAMITCSATHTVTLDDINAGHYANTACVDDNGGPAARACADEDVPAVQTKAIDLVKSASTSFSTPPVPGNTILYSFLITNIGNVTLTGVDLTDSLLGYNDVTCGVLTTLVPGASTTCSGTYTLTQNDINAGTVSNTATACGDPPTGSEVCDNDGTTTPITRSPALTVDKSADKSLITAAGEVVTYTYVVRNTGNITLTGVTLSDNKIPTANITCSPTQPATLLPTGTMNCSATYIVTVADLSNTNLVNIATADSDQTGPATDTVSIPIRPPLKGHIMHTGVTCSDFLSNNPSDELERGDYSVKSGKVNNASPGVMFYYGSITAPSSSITYVLTQNNDQTPLWKPIPVQGINQIILYTASCAKVNATSTYNAENGTATISANGLTAGSTYVVGVKYSISGLVGQPVSAPFPTVKYSFSATLNGGAVASSEDSISMFPKL